METGNKISEIIIENALISVVVPAYNIEKYLSECLDSILTQTYEKIEIIVVDDGSKDNSGKIADEYSKKHPDKIRCIHIENSGVSKARIEGIRVAKGEWIGFVDGDDMIVSDMYKRLMYNAELYQADISHCGYQTIVNDGERIHYFYNTGKLIEQDRLTALSDLIDGSFVEPGLWNKLFKRNLFEPILNSDILDHSIKINEDLMMNFVLFSNIQKAVYEDFCSYLYMARYTSATRGNLNINKILDPIKVKKWILEKCEPQLKPVAWKKYLESCIDTYAILISQKEMKQYVSQLKKELKINKEKWKYIGKKEKIKLKMLLLTPYLYRFIYKIYEKYFQRKVYE